MAYPSVISTLANPAPTDRLNAPSHSGLHDDENAAIVEIQTFLGTLPSSALGTLIYDVRSPDSNGGGHVQTAVKGGTGQTSYIKGDLLVAQSASVLAKLAVGSQGQVLAVDSSVATGLTWIANSRPKLAVSGSVLTFVGNINVAQSVMSVSIPASTLGSNNSVRARLFTEMVSSNSAPGFTWQAHYGGSLIGSQTIPAPGGNRTASIRGTIEINLIAANSPSSQQTTISNIWQQLGSSILGSAPTFTTLSVDSARSRNLDVSVTMSNDVGNASVISRGYVVEKIDS